MLCFGLLGCCWCLVISMCRYISILFMFRLFSVCCVGDIIGFSVFRMVSD